MRMLPKSGFYLLIGGVVALGSTIFLTGPEAEARPKYCQTFLAKYEGKAFKTAKCAICHVGKPGKVRNDYGKALEKALGEPEVEDKDAIEKALVAIESKESSTKGKTFGDLIKEGKLPAKGGKKEGGAKTGRKKKDNP